MNTLKFLMKYLQNLIWPKVKENTSTPALGKNLVTKKSCNLIIPLSSQQETELRILIGDLCLQYPIIPLYYPMVLVDTITGMPIEIGVNGPQKVYQAMSFTGKENIKKLLRCFNNNVKVLYIIPCGEINTIYHRDETISLIAVFR